MRIFSSAVYLRRAAVLHSSHEGPGLLCALLSRPSPWLFLSGTSLLLSLKYSTSSRGALPHLKPLRFFYPLLCPIIADGLQSAQESGVCCDSGLSSQGRFALPN